jgi:hypothetical protein
VDAQAQPGRACRAKRRPVCRGIGLLTAVVSTVLAGFLLQKADLLSEHQRLPEDVHEHLAALRAKVAELGRLMEKLLVLAAPNASWSRRTRRCRCGTCWKT